MTIWSIIKFLVCAGGDYLVHSKMYARMLENFPSCPLDPRGEELRREMSTHVVPPKRQKEIRRVFGEKIKFLSEDRAKIPLPSARALKHLHDYRNETQHQDQVRSESIKPATLVYFDIAADFLVRLHPGTTVWHGGQNYDWLKKYGIQQKFVSRRTHPVSRKDCALASDRYCRYPNRLGDPSEGSNRRHGEPTGFRGRVFSR